MVSRHFYEIDEVIAALHWCIRQGRVKEALFWCLELLDSELYDRLQEELYKIWLWLFGIGSLSLLPLLQNEDYIRTVYILTRCPKDRSVLALLLFGSQDTEQPDRVNAVSCLHVFDEFGCSELEKAFLAAVYQGKSRLAFDLSRPLWQANSARVYTLLQAIQHKKHKQESLAEVLTLLELQDCIEKWATRACAIASVSLNTKRLTASFKSLDIALPSELQECIQEWKALEGRRKRRIYAIPQECLYKITKRGVISNKQSTLESLYQISHKTVSNDSCPFWERILDEEVPWLDADRKDSFYEQFFPDDIPCEWSRADQEKSHGWGSLIHQEVPNARKYIERWYRDLPTRSYWYTNRDMQKYITEKDLNTLLDQPWDKTVSMWCLTPVKKRILVLEDQV